MSALSKFLRRNPTGGARRRGRVRRAAPIWLGLIVTVGSAIPPATGEVVPWLPSLPEIPVANADYPCSSHSGEWPTFTGKLSNSSGATLTESTTGDVYGRVTNVDRQWDPWYCGYYRYDAVIWATDDSTTDLTVHWGALSGDAQYCNYVVGSADYIHANAGACPSASTAKHVAKIGHEAIYQNDIDLDDEGDFGFAHADCIDWYTKDKKKTGVSTAVTNGKPGANCGYKQLDGTNTTQTLVVDGTPPSLSFSFPAAGGPVLVPSAFAGVTFTATDAVAGFGGTDDWDLERQIATWSGSACGTFGDDTGADALVSGTFNGVTVSSQGLQLGKCYRWKLDARDKNGNTATTVYSGSIRTDTSPVLGDQPQFGMESWDLGAGDTLAVSTGSGNLRITHPIVSLPIVGGALDLTASYNSHDTGDVGLGIGWRLDVQRRLTVDPVTRFVTFTDVDGSRHTFTCSPSPCSASSPSYIRPATLYATLTRDTAATPDRFTLTYRDLSKDIFDEDLTNTGLLKQVKDRHGNTTSIAYTAGTARISTITDPSSRSIAFTWTGAYLTQIVDWANVSGGIVQTSGSGNRTHRFFYSGANLIGWADPLNTSGSCPTAASHRTCLTYTSGFLSAIAKTQTYETFSAGTLGTATRTVTTSVTYEFADVTTVTDAEAAATTLSHSAAGETKVVRPGTPASETTYALVSPTDSYGRIDSVKRKLGAGQVETETTFNATYPIEPATVKENKGGGALEHVTNYTYQTSSLGLLTRLDEPLDGTYRRYTDLTYNANNDITRKRVYSTQDSTNDTDTRYCYTTGSCLTSSADTLVVNKVVENYADGAAGGTNGHVEDVITTYQYDGAGHRTRETRSNYNGSTLLDSAATGWTFDTYGNVASETRNYANGSVDCGTDDETPNTTSNARTDLTTTYTYDTAGNRVSTADPRRAIALDADVDCSGPTPAADDYLSRSVYDALNQAVTTRLPTTLGVSECSPSPACREATAKYDEFGLIREATDINGVVTATKYDKAGRALETYEDTPSSAAAITSISTYDAQGRLLTAKDREQSKAGSSLGYSQHVYDELGRMLAQGWAVGTGADTETDYGYDALDRQTSMITGVEDASTAQTTTWSYDIGGRVIEQNDEFTCSGTTYDYRDLALTGVEGKTLGTPCTGSGTRFVTNTYDGLARLTLSQVTAGAGLNDKLAENTYDSAGNTLISSATRSAATTSTTYTINPLDEVIAEVRSTGTWAKTNYDPAGSPTDRCLWAASPSDPCKPAGSTFNNPQPTSVTTSTYDGRNNRTALDDGVANTTTTYHPDHNYLVWGTYVPTSGGREHQTVFDYDERHRLETVTHVLCATAERPQCTGGNILTSTGSDTYVYDDNDNRTRVNEANGGGTLDSYYSYDAVERVIATRSTSGCISGLLEAYTYDDSGNRTTAGSTTFSYNTKGQLASCSAGCGTITYDAAGRTEKWNGWRFEYDAQGRITRACQTTAADCTGLYNELEYTYDGEGHRTQIKQYNAGSGTVVATTDFRYQGAAIVEEKLTDAAHPSGAVVRSYVVNDAGSVVKLTIPAGETGAGSYLVTWSGHGDALALWRIETSGSLTLANSFTYSTWGQPTTATHNGSADLGFRFLYVGEYDVAWDNVHGLGLAYMHARHYSPALGRFLQPDPDGSEANLNAYGANNPVNQIDPDGTCFIVCAIINAVIDTAIYLATTENATIEGAVGAFAFGAVTGFIGVGLLSKVAKIGAVARLSSRVGRAPYAERIVRTASQKVTARGPAYTKALLSPRQLAAARRNPNLEKAFLGQRYHQAVAREAATMSRNRISYHTRGPDFLDRVTRTRVELTTVRGLARHQTRYATRFPALRYVTY